MNLLSNELLLNIFTYLPIYKYIRAVCTLYRDIIDENVNVLQKSIKSSPLSHLDILLQSHNKLSTFPISEIRDYALLYLQDYIDWNYVVAHQKLSESLLHQFMPQINSDIISSYQILSETFIKQHANRLN